MMQTYFGLQEGTWVAVQSICAVLGFAGLIAYTAYTRGMMKLQRESYRASYTPVFGVSERDITGSRQPFLDSVGKQVYDSEGVEVFDEIHGHFDFRLKIANIGQGPATGITAWNRQVSKRFALNGTAVFPFDTQCTSAVLATNQLARDEAHAFFWRRASTGSPVLFIVEGFDIALGRHQLQALVTFEAKGSETEVSVNMRMVHARGDSGGERLARGFIRFREVLEHLDRLSKTLVD